MSDESSVTAPESGESASPDAALPDAALPDAAPPDTESQPASRLARMVPSWARRRPGLTGFGAGIVAAVLVKSSTLARYVPGATVGRLPLAVGDSGPPQITGCDWTSDSTGMLLSLTISADPDSATGNYQFSIEQAKKSQAGTTFLGAQPVRGGGEQATAVYQTLTASKASAVALYVLSGNASVELDASDVGVSPPLSRAGKLAADIAMARGVLASLHHS